MNGADLEKKKEKFAVLPSGSGQNFKFYNFTLFFWRGLQRHVSVKNGAKCTAPLSQWTWLQISPKHVIFSGFLSLLLKQLHNVTIFQSFWFFNLQLNIYDPNTFIFIYFITHGLLRTNKMTSSQLASVVSSVGRALHRYRKGHGWGSRVSLNIFQASFMLLPFK